MSAVDQYKQQANQVLDLIDERLQAYPAVQQLTSKVPNLRPSHVALGVVSVLTLFIFWGFGGRLFSNLVGFGWPLYESFASLKRKPEPGVVDEEDTQWLTYWVVYSTFTLLESASNFLETWIPLYHLVKIAFLLWCMLPQTRGALVIYSKLIEPLLVHYEGRIDSAHHRVQRSVGEVASDFADAGAAVLDAKKRELVDGAISNLIGKQPAAPGGAGAGPSAPAAEVESHTKSQ